MGVVRYLIPDFTLKKPIMPPMADPVEKKPEERSAWYSSLSLYAELFKKKKTCAGPFSSRSRGF
jgi:hypothetical protein